MRSPASPCSATSRKSLVPMSRPSGILPGENVFQLPPPAFEARATLEASAAGAGVATETPGGVAADATVNGVALGALGFWAITGAGVIAGGGDSSFCFLPHLLPFGGGVGLAS